MPTRYERIKAWLWKRERHISSLALLGGFIFDIFTLTRVDLPLENFWILVHLFFAGLGIVLLDVFEDGNGDDESLGSHAGVRFWLIIMMQFGFGGLFSTFLVFYFRSATLGESWPFLLVLAVALVCNEAFKKHYSRLTFRINLLFLAIFSFAIYALPVMAHRMDSNVFVASGLFSLLAIFLFLLCLARFARESFRRSRWSVVITIGVIYVGINFLYYANLIPPIPLSLKQAGIYHLVIKNDDGTYSGEYEHHGWSDYLTLYPAYHAAPDDTAYAYTAVFSPANLNIDIVHEWQHYDEQTEMWDTAAQIPLSIYGGRDGGYRTYSEKSGLAPGLWRVNVETTSGQLIGRIKFEVQAVSTSTDTTMPETAPLQTAILE